MFSLDRRYLILLVSGLFLGSLLLGLTLRTPARADVGAQPILPVESKDNSSNGQFLVIIGAISVIILTIAGFLVLSRIRGRGP